MDQAKLDRIEINRLRELVREQVETINEQSERMSKLQSRVLILQGEVNYLESALRWEREQRERMAEARA